MSRTPEMGLGRSPCLLTAPLYQSVDNSLHSSRNCSDFITLPYASSAEILPSETSTSTFMHNWHSVPSDIDAPRDVEPWSDLHETLLREWASNWEEAAKTHNEQANLKMRWHRLLQIPNILIPIVLAPLIAGKFVGDDQIIVALALILSGVAGGILSANGWERSSEQHDQAAFRYVDLISDVEEVIVKKRRYRPGCNITVQKFKMRMDSAAKYSPALNHPQSKTRGCCTSKKQDDDNEGETSEE